MAASFSMAGSVRVVPTWTDPLDLVDVVDRTTIAETLTLADGTAAGQADCYWKDVRTVAASTTDTVDLTALSLDVYGGTDTISIANARLIYVKNRSTTVALSYAVGAEAVAVRPGGVFLWYAPSNATAAAYSATEIRVTNAGASAVDYEVVVVGVKT